MATSVIIPPSFHYSIVIPACQDIKTTERFREHYMYLQWFIRFLFSELRFKDGVLHSPSAITFIRAS